MLAIGPGLAIPRTAATSIEVIQKGFLHGANPILLTMIFFLVVYLFVRKPNSIIDYLGKILTPILVLVLVLIIVKGILFPIGGPINTYQIQVFQNSFQEGYQTMDALASIVFAIVVTNGLKAKGITDDKMIKEYTIKSGVIAVIGLCFVYGGLLYIGATTSSQDLQNLERIDLLLYICYTQLKVVGKILICVAMVLACLTTAIGLTTTVGQFFHDKFYKKTNGLVSYDIVIIISLIFSAFFAVVGVEKILVISAPILSAIYPVAIVLIVMNLFDRFSRNSKIGAITGASIYGIIVLLNSFKLDFGLLKIIESVFPVQIKNFIWIIPAVLGSIIYDKIKSKR